MSFFEPVEEEKTRKAKKGHRVLGTATFCGFHHTYNLDISHVIGAATEAALQKSWHVVLEETL